MITKEMLEQIRSTLEMNQLTEKGVYKIVKIGDLWISKMRDDRILENGSHFYRIATVTIDGSEYTVYGRE